MFETKKSYMYWLVVRFHSFGQNQIYTHRAGVHRNAGNIGDFIINVSGTALHVNFHYIKCYVYGLTTFILLFTIVDLIAQRSRKLSREKKR